MPAKEIVRVDVVGRDRTGSSFTSAKRKADRFQDSISRLNARIAAMPVVQAAQGIRNPVSYTHLTLPTIYSV